MPPQHARILICGRDENLLATRGLVLKAAGFDTQTTVEPAALWPSLDEIDLFLICYTLSAEERENDLYVLTRSAPQAKTLCLERDAGGAAGSGTTLSSFAGPEKMVEVVRQLLGQ